MRLEKQNNKYVAIDSFAVKDQLKNSGFWYDGKSKLWYTDSPVMAAQFSEFAEGDLKLSLEDIKQQAIESMSSNSALSSNLKAPIPEGLELYPFQEVGVGWLTRHKNTLLADSMGLGKTAQAIAVINSLDEISRVLIICPASLRLNWRKELAMWLTRTDLKIQVMQAKDKWDDTANIVIINYDIIGRYTKEAKAKTWDLLVLDEAHYCRNPKTKRSVAIFGKRWRYSRSNEWEIAPIPAKRRIYITGTPIVNRPVELWPLVHSLDPVNFPSYDKFTLRYCGARKGRWGWEVSGATNMEELGSLLRSTVMIRRLKEEVLKELPPKIKQVIELPQDGCSMACKAEISAWKTYEASLKEVYIARELAKAAEDESDYQDAVLRLNTAVSITFRELSKERKRVAMAKVPIVLEYLENLDGKVVIFCHHRDVIHAFVSKLGDKCVWMNGERTAKDKQDAIDRFQEDPNIQYFIGSILSAGIGITLTAASLALFVELDWVPGNMCQAEDRLARIGQKDTVLIQQLVFNESVDAKIAHTLMQKQNIIDKALVTDVVLPFDTQPATISISWKEVTRQATNISDTTRANIRSALAFLSFAGHKEINEFDKIIIDNLLVASLLSTKEAVIGRQLIRSYKGIVGPEILNNIKD
jgi:SWI/SNF-related matrix-associated actin-dependent regulator 1 of chromatin subfamily A